MAYDQFPAKDVKLTVVEFQRAIHGLKARFLDVVSTIDIQLTVIISLYFLRKFDDFALFLDSVFDQDKWATFGSKIKWLSKILKHRFPDYEKRKEVINRLDKLRVIRNEFAHTFSMNPSQADADNRIIRLYDLVDGAMKPIEINAEDVDNIVSDTTFLFVELDKIEELIKADIES